MSATIIQEEVYTYISKHSRIGNYQGKLSFPILLAVLYINSRNVYIINCQDDNREEEKTEKP